jgi:hypothetical protein
MAELTIVWWREIPAQVIARTGRKSARAQLSARFAEAIDAAAMRAGVTASDDYLAEWRRGEPTPCGDDLHTAVRVAASDLEAAYDGARLQQLVMNGGRESGTG